MPSLNLWVHLFPMKTFLDYLSVKLTYYPLSCHQGFHAVHEKFMKMNQELHQVRRVFSSLQAQGTGADDPRMTAIKTQMDKGG